MPKIGMEPIRRRQVIDATMESIHEDGIAHTSLKRIAARAEITPGLILHYFKDKEGLYEAVYRDLYKRLADETVLRLKRAHSPIERLFAVLEAQVCDEMIEPKIVSTWFALGAKATADPALARMEHINSRRMTSNLVHILKGIGLPHREASDVAEELLAMIYGIWTNLSHRTFSQPELARTILFRFIRARVPELSD